MVGAHLSGMPLNAELTSIGAVFCRAVRTTPDYRLFALPSERVAKPGLLRAEAGAGASIEVEVWRLTAEAFAAFVASIPHPLGIGTLTLDDGTSVKGFLVEAYAAAAAPEITHFGGWRAFTAEASPSRG